MVDFGQNLAKSPQLVRFRHAPNSLIDPSSCIVFTQITNMKKYTTVTVVLYSSAIQKITKQVIHGADPSHNISDNTTRLNNIVWFKLFSAIGTTDSSILISNFIGNKLIYTVCIRVLRNCILRNIDRKIWSKIMCQVIVKTVIKKNPWAQAQTVKDSFDYFFQCNSS